ncbi:restriction endonuclease subunit S [Cronobacter sakazakii]|uniref:restriction endonuclease subunit S n=1 Tax=Cronobacter sakazakii TaxID=28141 RepID=UPI000B4AC427|nr:restriction endonuclease subunit S [Cronobacter sakazakii]EGT5652435.1 restriction endonuclease subunit S [Cronobacter sakazakii]EGT5749920.1 restriction endonuclease subunit S [Cronobacter sakazakii]KAB0855150.1 restriction endonuclease subunit S [Cronobacter sakazakii]PUW17039.1 restriction endonuclease subunit S [Cronobacter sakazakii]PUW17508.1 restriction endonuclease subunit S [Cronobacter sakazakii]
MSEMSYLEKLLDGTEVEWKALGDVTSVLRGKRLTKNLLSAEEKFPVFHGGLEPLGYYNKSNRPANTVMIINVGASAGTVGYSTVDFWSSDGCFCLEHNELLNNRFLYFALIGYQSLLKSKVRVAGIPTLDAIVVNKLLIPIPCPDNPEKSLAIQAEIVRILDKFTALTAKLTAELTMRKKQYNYYRDKLLSFEEGGVEWKTLGEIVKMRAGQHISARNIVDGKEGDFVYPCFGGNGIRGYVKEKSHDGEHLLIGRQGALCGNVQRMKGQFYATEHAVVVSAMQGIDIDWAFHMLTTMNLNQYASKSAQPGLAVGKLQELKLLVPSIERQKYIAKILDKFDTLTSSITEGLPREIELRQKQYEYYRDLLFSFPKPETASN